MKKKIIVVSIIFIMLIIILPMFFLYYNSKNISKKALLEVEHMTTKIDEIIHHFPKITSGKILTSALYKGAHGENYPKDFTYSFVYDKQVLTLENDIGSNNRILKDPLVNILFQEITLNKEMFKVIKEEKIKSKYILYLDEDTINDFLKSNFKEAKLEITASFLFFKIKEIKLFLDDFEITLVDNNVKIQMGNNLINLTINDNNYSLDINSRMRMNAFLDEKQKYNVVINNNIIYVEVDKENILIKASTPSAIYNGLNLNIKSGTYEIKNREHIDDINIPIWRYFDGLDLNYWEAI